MIGDLRDRSAYALAIASLGFGLVVILAGICWIVVQHKTGVVVWKCASSQSVHYKPWVYVGHSPATPAKLWIALAALAGLLIGALVPFPLPASRHHGRYAEDESCSFLRNGLIAVAPVALFVAATAIVLTADEASPGRWAIAAILIGLLIPSPARAD